jgi:hypothetical protein
VLPRDIVEWFTDSLRSHGTTGTENETEVSVIWHEVQKLNLVNEMAELSKYLDCIGS